MKDVAMAADLGVDNVWARYGQAQSRADYALLREVTHWTDNDVAREKMIIEGQCVVPKFVAERTFDEVLGFSNLERMNRKVRSYENHR